MKTIIKLTLVLVSAFAMAEESLVLPIERLDREQPIEIKVNEDIRGDFCEIHDLSGKLLGVSTTNSAKIARVNSETGKKNVVGLAGTRGIVYAIGHDTLGPGDLIYFEVGRSTSDGEIYDYKDQNLIGSVADDGKIKDGSGKIVGSYSGCINLPYEDRLQLVAAASHRLLLFDFKKHSWDRVFFRYCTPGLCVW